MPKKEIVLDEKTKRLVLRGLVSYNYFQISGIFNSANKGLSKKDFSLQISYINDEIATRFLNRDYKAGMFYSSTKNWQDYLSAESLFDLFVFQSLIINKMQGLPGSASSDKFFYAISKISSLKNVIPKEISFEDKLCFPLKHTGLRSFIDDNSNRREVLLEMLSKKTEDVYEEQQIRDIKAYIEKTMCFGKYSGFVAESFFKEKMLEAAEVLIDTEKDSKNIFYGLNLDKQVGVTEDGQPIYESENGNFVGTFSEQVYSGDIFELDEEDPDKRVFLCSSSEYLEQNKNSDKENNQTENSDSISSEQYIDEDQLSLPLQ